MSNTAMDPSRIFTRQQVDDLLTAAIGKTLLQVDKGQWEESIPYVTTDEDEVNPYRMAEQCSFRPSFMSF